MTDTSVVSNSLSLAAISTNPGGIQPPDFSKFRFRHIGQPPALLDRFSAPEPGPNYRSPSPETSNGIEVEPSGDYLGATPSTTIIGSRKSLLETLAGDDTHQGGPLPSAGANNEMTGMDDSRQSNIRAKSAPRDVSPPKPTTSGVTSLVFTQPPNSTQAVPTSPASMHPSPTASASHFRPEDQEEIQASPSPLLLINHLSDIVHERAELEKIRDLRKQFAEEREEFCRRIEETLRAVQRSTQQADRVTSIADEAFTKTEIFILKQEKILESEKVKAEANISARRAAEQRDQLRRQAQMENRQRQQEEERRKAFEDELRRKEEEEERTRQEELREAERRRRQEEEQRLHEIESRRKEEERKAEETAKREKQQKEELAQKQEEMRVKLAERRKKAEEERQEKDKEREAAEAKKRAEEELRQKLYQERKAASLAKKWKGADPSPNDPQIVKEQIPQDGPSSLLSSPPSSSTSSQKQPFPEQPPAEADEKLQRRTTIKPDGKNSSAAAKQELKTSFVPATTEAGKLVSIVTLTKSEDGATKQQPAKTLQEKRAAQVRPLKSKLKTAPSIKKEPVSPTIPAQPEQQPTSVRVSHNPPSATIPSPVDLSSRVTPSGPAIFHAAVPPHQARLPPDLPRRPSLAATREPSGPLRRPRPPSPAKSPSPARTPPRPFVRGRSSTAPRSLSPAPPTPRRSRSPTGRGVRTGCDHYSPPLIRETREHWSPDYRTRGVEFPRRDPSPPYLSRKRPRDSDSWISPDDSRTGIPAKRRAVHDPSPVARISPRSPSSPRQSYTRRAPGQERPVHIAIRNTQASSLLVTDAYDARRRTASGPPKQPSKWIDDSQSAMPAGNALPPLRSKFLGSANVPEGTLLDRMSHNQSPSGPRVPNRKHVPLEHRLTSGPGSTSLAERLS